MESLVGTGTALHDAAKRLVPDSGNAVAATERDLEFSPLIVSALVECVFFDAGALGPLRKAHELWAAARVGVCKNHAAGRQLEARRSTNSAGPAASNSEPDDGPVRARDDDGDGHLVTRRAAVNDGEPGGSSDVAGDSGEGGGGGDHGSAPRGTDRRTQQRLDDEPAPASGGAAASSPRATELPSSVAVAATAPPPPAGSHDVPPRASDHDESSLTASWGPGAHMQ